jgi:hypothetical protein
MRSKFGRYSSSSSSSHSCPPSSFHVRYRPLLLSAIIIVIIALQVLSQSPTPVHSQSVQYQIQDNAAGLSSVDNFNLPDGYIIETFLSNLSMPTSIAVDSGNGSIYVAESVWEYNEQDHGNSTANGSTALSSSSSSFTFLSQPPQVRILKADTNTNTTTTINNALNWPVIDMVVDDSSGLMYAFHDHTTISRMNMTSGERQDIIATEEEEAADGTDKYEEQQQDPLSFIINSSSQIALSGKGYNHEGASGDDFEQGASNSDSQYQPALLYIPCVNGDVDGFSNYCILSLPVDGNSAIADSNSINDNSSSFIVQNMTSRPVGIAILNSSNTAASSSSSSSLPSNRMSEQNQSPYALASSQTSSSSFGNNNNNYVELLIITSQPPSSSIENNINDNNEDGTISHRGSNFSDDAAIDISTMSTIEHAKISSSTPYEGISSDNPENTINNNDSYRNDNNSNYNQQQEQATTTSLEGLVDYPYGQLGQVEVVFVPPVMTSSSSYTNDTAEMNQAPSTSLQYDEDTVSSPPPFGLNESTAFIVDFGNQNNSSGSDEHVGNDTSSSGIIDYSLSLASFDAFFGNSSTSGAAAPPYLPKIVMLDIKTGNIAPFLTLKQPDSNFVPIDLAFDYKNDALYVLSISNNNENITNNNGGVIWKISYQGEAEASATSNNDSSFGNGTDNYDNSTDDLAEDSSSNDTALDDNSTTDSSSSYDEEQDDTDDESVDGDSSGGDSDSGSNEDTGNNTDSGSSPSPSPPPADDAPIAEDDAATTNQDTPVVIDVLANDRNADENDDSLTIDSVDEQSIQGGSVRIISGSVSDDNSNTGNNNDNANDKIEYTPAVGFFGSDEFTYTIVDGNGATDSATVTVTVKEVVVLAPHPISYWLENEEGITEDLLEKAAEDHDNNEWSFNLGNFRVPVEFDVSDSQNDTKGILETSVEGNNNNNENDNDNTNTYDQLAAQLLAAKLNIENGVSTCESITTTIEYADTVLTNAQYSGPGSTENPTGESRDYAFELIEILDSYNNNGCI